MQTTIPSSWKDCRLIFPCPYWSWSYNIKGGVVEASEVCDDGQTMLLVSPEVQWQLSLMVSLEYKEGSYL